MSKPMRVSDLRYDKKNHPFEVAGAVVYLIKRLVTTTEQHHISTNAHSLIVTNTLLQESLVATMPSWSCMGHFLCQV